MRVIYSGASPKPIVSTSYSTASAPGASFAPAATPAATVEISSAARGAYSKGEQHAPAHKIRPLNIIWGNSPK